MNFHLIFFQLFVIQKLIPLYLLLININIKFKIFKINNMYMY